MAKTVRINVLLSPDEKASIDERAKRANVTTSELVRRAVDVYDPDVNLDEIRGLAEELADVVERTESRLDANLAEIAALRKELANEGALKAKVRAELEASGKRWPFAELPEDIEVASG